MINVASRLLGKRLTILSHLDDQQAGSDPACGSDPAWNE
jgi:hypothetical protein